VIPKGYKKENLLGEVPLTLLCELQERARIINPDYNLYFYGGQLVLKKKRGRPFKTYSINKLIWYVEKLEGRGLVDNKNNKKGLMRDG